jgi:quercetin dioxygenase-like cupin family protein
MSPPPAAVQPKVRSADAAGYVAALEGVLRKTLLDGGRTQIVEFRLARGAVIPLHDHPQEQTGYLVSGRMTLTIAGVDHDLKPGDAWTIPGGIAHGATIAEDSVAIEVFSPLRPDYRR